MNFMCISYVSFSSVNLPLHHKVQKFSSGTGWSWKKGRKTVGVLTFDHSDNTLA